MNSPAGLKIVQKLFTPLGLTLYQLAPQVFTNTCVRSNTATALVRLPSLRAKHLSNWNGVELSCFESLLYLPCVTDYTRRYQNLSALLPSHSASFVLSIVEIGLSSDRENINYLSCWYFYSFIIRPACCNILHNVWNLRQVKLHRIIQSRARQRSWRVV